MFLIVSNGVQIVARSEVRADADEIVSKYRENLPIPESIALFAQIDPAPEAPQGHPVE